MKPEPVNNFQKSHITERRQEEEEDGNTNRINFNRTAHLFMPSPLRNINKGRDLNNQSMLNRDSTTNIFPNSPIIINKKHQEKGIYVQD